MQASQMPFTTLINVDQGAREHYVLEYRNTKLAVNEAKAWDEALSETGRWRSRIADASNRGHAAGGMLQPGCFVFARTQGAERLDSVRGCGTIEA